MTSPLKVHTPRSRLRILRRPTEPIRPSTPRAERRDCHGRLATAMLALAGAGATIEDAGFRPWCSATFLGAQHRLTMRFAGADAAARADRFAASVSEANLPIPGHLVADGTVDAIRPQDDGSVLVDLAVLTIEDW
jgi:hypothetical protein